MNERQKRMMVVSAVGVIVVVGILWVHSIYRPDSRNGVFAAPLSVAASPIERGSKSSLSSSATPGLEEQKKAMNGFLTSFSDSMKKMGLELPTLAASLRRAVRGGDHGEIIRAFQEAVYGRSEKMSKSLPAIRAFLGDSDPFVRYTAAQSLYIAGDRSGFQTLLAMVTAGEPMLDGQQDLRVEAAVQLAKFREEEAGAAITRLYRATSGPGLLSALALLGDREIVPDFEKRLFIQTIFRLLGMACSKSARSFPRLRPRFKKRTIVS